MTAGGTEQLLDDPESRVIWITWQNHRRAQELSAALGVPLLAITGGKGLGRYARATIETIRVIASRRPTVLIVQNPSMILAVLAAALKPVFGFSLIVDRHTYYFPRSDTRLSIKRRIAYWLSGVTIRASDLTIVTNEGLATLVNHAGGESFILPDRIPDFGPEVRAVIQEELGDPIDVLFVSTYASDEPLDDVVDAARQLGRGFRISITGRPRGRFADPKFIKSLPSNVRLTGFLSEENYATSLARADLVLVLTTLENCLTCGAYEAVALGKVMVLSDTVAIRSYFRGGAVYALPNAVQIAQGIESAVKGHTVLAQDVRRLGRHLSAAWEDDFRGLRSRLRQLGQARLGHSGVRKGRS